MFGFVFQEKKIESEKKQMSVPVTDHERLMKDGTTIISITDLKGKITYANKEFLDIAGYTEEEVIGKPHNMVRHPDVPRSAFKDLWSTIQSGNPWRGIVKNRAKNGDHYWVDAVVVPRIQNGSIVGYMSVRRQPTRKQIEEASQLYEDILSGKAKAKPTVVRKLSIRKKSFLFVLATLFSLGTISYMRFIEIDPLLISISAAGFALLQIAFGYYYINYILNPLREATAVTNKIATGDLSVNIAHNRGDEIGELQKAILKMLINTAPLISKLKEDSDTLLLSSQGLSEASMSLSSGTEEMSQQSQTIASAATQMNQNLSVVSSSVEEMSVSIGEVAKKAAASAKIAKEANSTAMVTSKEVKELGENAHAIGNVIEIIAKISAQTKLLALNAAIEASSAGEAGRGFAVVASEVKELARQSAESSGDIKSKISAIQLSTEKVIDMIEKITSVISQVNQISSSIASAVEEQSITTKEIAANIGQTSLSSNDVTRNIQGISTASREGATDASKVSKFSQSLQDLASVLTTIVNQFKISNSAK
ncbi:aerotaxis receptor Aer [Leptospira perolatii]|uniref:Aerotaxis receptor Aer n=1 Tax=Leptospira perolatii TaxID=2023191 RepID=A0A2M9ZP17_9LEPT|nr:methyl-accepting chemotaxis protein [Leptospira perolatii]PJZ70604.1 aerotaxis receptor Aer [Leptospira perolatii]PJZ73816.1 aerotaxis receptor Aer [Leptospira perolatii]